MSFSSFNLIKLVQDETTTDADGWEILKTNKL